MSDTLKESYSDLEVAVGEAIDKRIAFATPVPTISAGHYGRAITHELAKVGLAVIEVGVGELHNPFCGARTCVEALPHHHDERGFVVRDCGCKDD